MTVYAFTLFSTFLMSVSMNMALLLFVAILLAGTSFCATFTWALFGTAIRTHLDNPRLRAIVNIILSLLLVYTAATLAGFL